MLYGSDSGQWSRLHYCPLCKQHPTGRVAGRPDGCVAMQRDLDPLEMWTSRNLVKFNRDMPSPGPGEESSLGEGSWRNATAYLNLL